MIAWFVASHLFSTFAGGGLLKLFLGNLMGDLKKLWGWLCHRSFWQLMFGGALLLAGFEYIGKRAEQRHAHKVETQLSKSEAARKSDYEAYAKAQAAAATQNKAQVAKVEQQYQRNSDNERQSYLDDLARLRRLRGQNSAAQGAANGAGSSPASGPAAGADANGLSVPSSDDVQAASEIELRLMHLQNWVEKQLSVDPNR